MENLIIEKPGLKFMVEVTTVGGVPRFRVNRFLEASSADDMFMSAQLAKFDALRLKGKFYNCHELIHDMVSDIQDKMNVRVDDSDVKFILRRNRTFGEC